MKNIISIVVILISLNVNAQRDEYSVMYLTQQIKNSVEEHENQKNINKENDKVLISENYLEDENEKYKERTSKLKQRLGHINFTIETLPYAARITRSMDNIFENIGEILQTLIDHPEVALFNDARTSIIDLGHQTKLNFNFIKGVVLAVADGNAMEIADRKTLINHLVNEIRLLEIKTQTILRGLNRRIASIQRMDNSNWYENKDLEYFTDIMQN
jgi:hypothetical protein